MKVKLKKIFLMIMFLTENALGVEYPLGGLHGVIPEHQKCNYNKDCTRVSLRCSCDCGVEVNEIFLSHYLEIKTTKCQEYSGPYCKMACPEEVICANGTCMVVKEER